MDDIIDKVNNPFRKDSWIEQGYSFTPDRQELTPILFKRSIDEIKSFKYENYQFRYIKAKTIDSFVITASLIFKDIEIPNN
jgi:hypothetical protein